MPVEDYISCKWVINWPALRKKYLDKGCSERKADICAEREAKRIKVNYGG
jgi:hypothetical protein